MAIDLSCPKCQSEQTQAIRVMRQAGTQRGVAGTTGLSYSRGTGIGISGSESKIAMRSELASAYSAGPFPKRSSGLPITSVLALLAALISVQASGGKPEGLADAAMFAGIGLLCWWLWWRKGPGEKEAQENWHARNNYLERAWMCHRCGHDWIPREG